MAEIQASDTPQRMLEAVERGETVIIKRGDRAIARVVPEVQVTPVNEHERKEAFARLEEFRRSVGKWATVEEILAWRHEGHKY